MTHADILYIQVHGLDGVIILNFNICVGGVVCKMILGVMKIFMYFCKVTTNLDDLLWSLEKSC